MNKSALSTHAIFKCIVIFAKNSQEISLSNIKFANDNEKQRLSDYKTILVINDDNINYNGFIQEICTKLNLPKFMHLQLNYWNKNNYHNFEINTFRYDPLENPLEKYTHSIAILYSPIPQQSNERIHQIFLSGSNFKQLGPFPFVWCLRRDIYAGQGGKYSTSFAMWRDEDQIKEKFLELMGLNEKAYKSLLTITSISAYGQRIHDPTRPMRDREWLWHFPGVKKITLRIK